MSQFEDDDILAEGVCTQTIRGTNWGVLILRTRGSQDDYSQDMIGKRFVGLVFRGKLPRPPNRTRAPDAHTEFMADEEECVISAVRLALSLPPDE